MGDVGWVEQERDLQVCGLKAGFPFCFMIC